MPFVYLIVAALVIFAVLPKGESQRQDGLVAPDEPPKQPSHPGAAVGKSGGIGALLKFGSDQFVGQAFASKEAKAVATYGLAIAITVGAINIVAGVLIAVVVLVVSAFIDAAVAFDDFTNHRQQEGVDAYWRDWHKVYDTLMDFYQRDAMVKQQTIDAQQLEYACNAYADGYMSQLNYLRAWVAYCGGVWGRNSAGPNFGMVAVVRAWRKGMYAGTVEPTVSVDGVHEIQRWAASNGHVLPYEEAQKDGLIADTLNQNGMMGAYGTRMLDISPPRRNYDPALFTEAEGKSLLETYYQFGVYQANASLFLASLHKPVPAFSSRLAMLVNERNTGFWQGAPLRAPDPGVPENFGLLFGNSRCYAPTGDEEILFTQV